jgi:transcription antitermination factor NusG
MDFSFNQAPVCNEQSPAPWVALMVRPRAERKIQTGLARVGVESFVPWHGMRRRWSDRIKTTEQNLFPGYVFCRSTFSERLAVLNQPGVQWVVSFGHSPALIPDQEISSLRRIVESDVPLSPWPFLKAGQRVRVTQGVLAGMEGSLVRDSTAWRVVMSVNALERSIAIQLDREAVCPIGAPSDATGHGSDWRMR